MKKIINGRRYDSDTARELGSDCYGYPNDSDYWSERLYQKSTGEFFIYCEGGPQTKYASRRADNFWGFGEELIPLSISAAKEWAEKHLTADQYEQIFGAVAEGDPCDRVSVTIRMPADLVRVVKLRAAEANVPISDLVTDCVRAGIADK